MLQTKFSEKEMTEICQILKRHGTDCATLVDILSLANSASSNDAIATFKRVRLLKEFEVINDRTLLCHHCVMDVINHHSETCEEHKRRMNDDKYFLPCPDEHYDYSKCESAVWMVDSDKIHRLEEKAAEKDWEEGRRDNIRKEYGDPIFEDDEIVGYEKDKRRYDHIGRTNWLLATFPDIDEQVRFNPWMGFFCDKHVGSMREFSDKITGYREDENGVDKKKKETGK